ncbi:Probable RNA-directed DNA polymerase from transposon X-element [Eumeta japonica]|uniref:Probable RNA-directed DNA polymerase from transposon X-element n=1 Tax=Eumeta variegata TaxID=151549 RepID=A0A4C1SD15_EUMVA|nr:Probable RNA-directed DNA polymerase from transposon X-element [Eumeta japonica]
MFLNMNKIDIALISETRFTSKSFLSVKGYTTYNTNHPSGNAHGGTAVLIKCNIKHHSLEPFATDKIQATLIKVSGKSSDITIAAVYCPPKHQILREDYRHFFSQLGHRYIIGGDWNAKHLFWGSRLVTTRGRQLYQAVKELNLECLSTGEPTYWPTDPRKTLIYLTFHNKNIIINNTSVESDLDLTSDHSAVILNVNDKIILNEAPPRLYNKKTNWEEYRDIITEETQLTVSLKTVEEVEQAIEDINKLIHSAANRSTPQGKAGRAKEHVYPTFIRDSVTERRRLRREWQNNHYARDKTAFNKASQQLKALTKEWTNEVLQDYLAKLTPTSDTNYSLYKATKNMKRPKQQATPIKTQMGTWARSDGEKAATFADHLQKVFEPPPSNDHSVDNEIDKYLSSPNQLCLPLKHVTLYELSRKYENLKKWKIAQVVMIQKPGKLAHDVTSYRPISLLPVVGKLLEKIVLNRMREHLTEIIPTHQFGFREGHGTIEQVHRLVDVIGRALENKLYCCAAFLDISQAFDKVWHSGLLYKIKKMLPHSFFPLLKSYLENRCYEVKINSDTSDMHVIRQWRIKANTDKSVQVTFTLRRKTCPPVKLCNVEIPQADDAKYLGMHLDRRLTWRKHIWTKRKQLDCKLRGMYWLIGRKSQLSDASKMTIYKTILKPVWTYGIQLWGTASHSNIEILERFQSKTMRAMFNIPPHISNKYINLDLNLRTVKEEIENYSKNYQTRLDQHINQLVTELQGEGSLRYSRLKRNSISDLAIRFAEK